jgi:hypothetical protein
MIRAAFPHGLRFAAACAIIIPVPTQWEIAGPRWNDSTGQFNLFPRLASGLLRPAVSAIRLQGAVFASGDSRP